MTLWMCRVGKHGEYEQKVGADHGLLVCWGGFKSSIMAEIPQQFFTVRLWDQGDLVDQVLECYVRSPKRSLTEARRHGEG